MILDENYSIGLEKDNVTLYFKKSKGINEQTGKAIWSTYQSYYPSVKIALKAYLDRCLKENTTVEGMLSEIKRVEEIINTLK